MDGEAERPTWTGIVLRARRVALCEHPVEVKPDRVTPGDLLIHYGQTKMRDIGLPEFAGDRKRMEYVANWLNRFHAQDDRLGRGE